MTISVARGGDCNWMSRFVGVVAVTGALACSSNSGTPNAPAPSDAAAMSDAPAPSDAAAASDATQVSAVDSAVANDSATSSAPSDASIDQAASSAADGSQSILNIMAVGDSITRDTCWRALLWEHLHQTFPSRFHLVGTLNSDPGCSVGTYETANQGYASSLVTEVVAGVTTARTCDPFCPALSDLMTAFNTVKPDVMLLHYGTNDVWNNIAPTTIINAYSAVIDAMRAANPNVIVLLAQIIPMNVTAATCAGCSCASCPTAVPGLNAQIATWAPTKSTAASPIIVVDQYTGFDAVADTSDGVHPNATTGSQKMADKWYAALAALF